MVVGSNPTEGIKFYNFKSKIIIDIMTRIIGVLGGKGGVGKTTLISNLATALTELGQDVVAVDANLTTPNLGLHLGMHLAKNTLHDVLKGEKRIEHATYYHPTGFKVIPASIAVDDLRDVDVGRLPEVTLNLLGRADYVLIDCAAGLGREAVSAITAADELLIITNPEMPSVADALKTIKVAEDLGKKIIGVVVNRRHGRAFELTSDEVVEILGLPIIAEIPEDRNMTISISLKSPLVEFLPHSPASVEIRRLAHFLCDKPFAYEIPKSENLIDRLVNWLVG